MNKTMKRIGIGALVLFGVLFVAFKVMQTQTKKKSPEVKIDYSENGKELHIFYCQPSARGRVVFGDLVPFESVWRTGANEASTFEISSDILVEGKPLAAGKYTLWTIPNRESWSVIFNKKQYGWGVAFGGVASREQAEDALVVDVPVKALDSPVETFTISLQQEPLSGMSLTWEKTQVPVKLSWK